jgi:hypothetical protein
MNKIKGAYFIKDSHGPTIMIYKLCTLNHLKQHFPKSCEKNQILLLQNYYLNFLVLKKDYLTYTDHPGPSTFNTIEQCPTSTQSCSLNEPFEKLHQLIPDFPEEAYLKWKEKFKEHLEIQNNDSSYYDYCIIT